MIQKLKTSILYTFAFAFVAAPLVSVGSVSAQAKDIQKNLCGGVGTSSISENDTTCAAQVGDADSKLNELISQIINIFSLVVGIVAVIMIIVGGFRYITSGGDSGNVTNAKNTIMYALIGLVVVALAQFIVKFVVGRATGTDTSA